MSLTGRYILMGGLFLFFSLAVGLGGDPLMHASLPATVGFLALMLVCVLAVAAVVGAVVNGPPPSRPATVPSQRKAHEPRRAVVYRTVGHGELDPLEAALVSGAHRVASWLRGSCDAMAPADDVAVLLEYGQEPK